MRFKTRKKLVYIERELFLLQDLGTPSESTWTGFNQLPAVQKMTFAQHPVGGLRQRAGPDQLSETGLSLLQGFLTYDPNKRITADVALNHAYFQVINYLKLSVSLINVVKDE